jgi:predicted MFS family arabinose efflux permease
MAAAPAPSPPRFRGALAALEHPEYRWLLASNLAFFLAMGAQGIVRSWLAFQLTQSELALGLVSFMVAVPMLVMAPLGGIVADRRERRALIAAGQATVLVTEGAVLALLLAGALAFWHLLVASAVMGCVFPFIMPARQAIVANIAGKSGLANAMALNMAGMNVTRVVGPAAGGFGIGALGLSGTYAAGVVLYALALACLVRVRRSRPDGAAASVSMGRNLLEGLRYLREDRLVTMLLLFGLIPMFLAMPFQTLLVVFAEEVWNVGSSGLGLLSGLAGAGGVVGSLWVAWRHDSGRRAERQLLSMLGFGGFLLLFAQSPWFWPAVPAVLLANVFASVYGTLNNTAIQILIPDHVRGRISSFLMMSFSLPLLGTLPMSALAEARGAPLAVSLASVLAIAVALLFYAASPALRHMDAAVRRALLE